MPYCGMLYCGMSHTIYNTHVLCKAAVAGSLVCALRSLCPLTYLRLVLCVLTLFYMDTSSSVVRLSKTEVSAEVSAHVSLVACHFPELRERTQRTRERGRQDRGEWREGQKRGSRPVMIHSRCSGTVSPSDLMGAVTSSIRSFV